MTFANNQLPSTMHLFLQLHCFCFSVLSFIVFQLIDIIRLFIFSIHEYDILNCFLLKILWYGCTGPKFWLIISRNRFPIFFYRKTKYRHKVQEVLPFPFGIFIITNFIFQFMLVFSFNQHFLVLSFCSVKIALLLR